MKRLFACFLIMVLTLLPVSAAEKVKSYGKIQHDYSINKTSEKVVFSTDKDISIDNIVNIPKGSVITAEFCQSRAERRWHKSAYIICKLLCYIPPETVDAIDVSESDIYFAIRKYEMLDKKEAAILSTEIVLTQAASIVGSCFIIFAPVDIAYFFAKGAIQREKHPNWFKAGVYNAYDNSIFWFWLKGKNIELSEGDGIKIQSMKKNKAQKLTEKITKVKEKNSIKNQKREEKLALKEQKAYERETKRLDKYEIKCNKKSAKIEQKYKLKEEKLRKKQEKKLAKQETKRLKKEALNENI